MKSLMGNLVLYRLKERFERLYGRHAELCLRRAMMLVGRYGIGFDGISPRSLWDHTDTILITYPDMINALGELPLRTLNRFLKEHLKEAFSIVHLLPFFPFSGDDGFAVEDYRSVRPGLGTWDDIHQIGTNFSLMMDLILNHVSRYHPWFKDYLDGIAPARNYFIETDPSTDLRNVVRPRSTPLLTHVITSRGPRYIWTTFSAEQIDLNYHNPDVLFEFLDLLLYYISHGARIIRLDAIAYLWKKIGTPCIHLPETHEIVKLIRDFLSLTAPGTILLTETNVPQEENLSYFGEGDEAHMVYQFPLPPLLLHALLRENSTILTGWLRSLPEPPPGCTFLNFTASHDGIGLRPAEGILPPDEIAGLVHHCRKRAGRITSRKQPDGSEAPYELNITYFDALGEENTASPAARHRQLQRFVCSQLVSLQLKGIPAIYFNSLVAAPNDLERVKKLGYARAINRTKWQEKELLRRISSRGIPGRAFHTLVRALRIRRKIPSFHPDGLQRVLNLGEQVLAVERRSPDGRQAVLCLNNLTGKRHVVHLDRNEEHSFRRGPWRCPLSERQRGANGRVVLAPYETVWLVQSGSGA